MEDSLKQVMHNMVRLVVENMICGSPCMAHCVGENQERRCQCRYSTSAEENQET